MIKIKIPLMFFLLLVSLTFVFAEEVNLSVEDQATICINESRLIIDELQVANFSIERANDSLKQASNIYLSQTLLEKNGRTGDFGLVLPHCNTISQLKEDAYNSRDALLALDRFYNETFQDDKINTSSVDIMITQINDEIKSERYEKVQPLITQTYEEIINVKSEYSTLNLFYNSTSRSLKKFFLDNWQIIIISLSGLLVLFLIYRSSIHRILIKKKIANLTSRKESLRRL
ncbi:hypothetical protein H8D91_02335, partial [archaeon]|nr:hypothetical protein [archaeon]